jgi:hypothetical protein
MKGDKFFKILIIKVKVDGWKKYTWKKFNNVNELNL